MADDYLDDSISEIQREDGKQKSRKPNHGNNKIIRQEFGHNGPSENGSMTIEEHRPSENRTYVPSVIFTDDASRNELRQQNSSDQRSVVKFGTNQIIDIGRNNNYDDQQAANGDRAQQK